MGNVAPIPNQRATAVPIKKTVVATGRRKGFWNLLTFSRKGLILFEVREIYHEWKRLEYAYC